MYTHLTEFNYSVCIMINLTALLDQSQSQDTLPAGPGFFLPGFLSHCRSQSILLPPRFGSILKLLLCLLKKKKKKERTVLWSFPRNI